ncbi:MAG: ChaN family lipoprotein [Caldimicrobium sp.]|nr:ChaN family lipoprotein [Caldimicrobium sp.]MCX7873738.1 ChaN family lipoprotein [Caldimicrobium sp.]MDW8093662.1 ChaN family lipoprotein [Caldimicrobium sp.]
MAILFLLIFLFSFINSLWARPLKGFYELHFDRENRILRGKASFELEKEGFYEFFLGNIKLLEFSFDNATGGFTPSPDGKTFKIYNYKKNSKVILLFERDLPSKSPLGYRIINDYLPYPLERSFIEISLKIPIEDRHSLFIPAEEEFVRDDGYVVYKINKALKEAPPLVMGAFVRKDLKLEGTYFTFLFPNKQRIEEKEWKTFESSLRKELARLPEPSLFTPFNRIFFLSAEGDNFYPLIVSMPITLKERDLPLRIFKNTLKQALRFGLDIKENSTWEIATLSFVEYFLSVDQKDYRKRLLLNDPYESIVFFYFYEKLTPAKEREFFNFFFSFLRKYLFTDFKEAYLSKALSERFGIDFREPPTQQSFCKITLKPFPEIKRLENRNSFHLRVKFNMGDCFRPLSFRMIIRGKSFVKEQRLNLDRPEKIFDFYLKDSPESIQMDPDYEIYRKLTYLERDLDLNSLFQRRGTIYLPTQEVYPLYKELIHLLRDYGYTLKIGLPDVTGLPKGNIVLLDQAPKNFHLALPKEGFYFKGLLHPRDIESALFVVKASSLREFREAWQRRELWKDAEEVFFLKGRLITKIEKKPTDGINIDLVKDPIFTGIRTVELMNIKDLVLELLPYQVVLIGESHDQYSHHFFQLQVIKNLRYYTKDLVIGLEMVQVPFQRYLDEFIEGKLSERELLEKIEYFDRWRFDWRLYRDIFLWAREQKIKLLALDVPQEIVKRIFRSGIDALSPEERVYLPELDLNNPSYEDYLRKSFEKHPFTNNASFEFFYLAQAVRDEGMAERILDYLRKHPEKKMIVLVGKGHLLYGFGIPQALKRRNFHQFKTIILGDIDELTSTVGDYWFPLAPMSYSKTPQLGLILEEVEQGLRVKEVLENTPSSKADIKVGDILLKVNNQPVRKINTLKILLSINNREEIEIELLRNNKIVKINIRL